MHKKNNFFTKAQVLDFLKKDLKHAFILPLYYFSVKEWNLDEENILLNIHSLFSADTQFVVRSSAFTEDQLDESAAGKYTSVLNVSFNQLKNAVLEVINSFKTSASSQDQILVQPMLSDISMCGVLFTHDQSTGAPYYIINYDESGSSSSVTDGSSNGKVRYISHVAVYPLESSFSKLIKLVKELQLKLNMQHLDIEFAFDKKENLYLFQVRPLLIKTLINKNQHESSLFLIEKKIDRLNFSHTHLYGERTLLGVMPDWNPAEIIGIRPKPLALSLYKELITDGIWAYQRDNYGYKNLRSFPLLIDLMGLPYIDIRVSFNSFIPKSINPSLTQKLVNYYIDRLVDQPYLHDKVEFEILFSSLTFDTRKKIKKLKDYGFLDQEIEEIEYALEELTNNIIHREKGLWKKDLSRVDKLIDLHKEVINNNSFDYTAKIYWLIEHCKRYGTLPFAGLARAGFIAIQFLNSMVEVGILSSSEKLLFLNNLKSVSSDMVEDLSLCRKDKFLDKYGHLRPGTYDILSLRYDEAPDMYFNWDKKVIQKDKRVEKFKLSLDQMHSIEKELRKNNLEYDVVGLFSFMKSVIEGREYAKFIFTKTVSDILSLLKDFGQKQDLKPEDMSYLDIKDIMKLYTSARDETFEIRKSIDRGKEYHAITKAIILPDLIVSKGDIYDFTVSESQPNFITHKTITGAIITDLTNTKLMKGAVVFIPAADPGYDWIFTHNIGGFVTAYGGSNSHMAIRASELGLPAIIGAGKESYNSWVKAKNIYIDCMNRQVKVLQ